MISALIWHPESGCGSIRRAPSLLAPKSIGARGVKRVILGQKKVLLKIYVEHYQQAIKSYNFWLIKYTKSSNYNNAYSSLDIGTNFKWSVEGSGYGVTLGTKDELSVQFNKVNRLIAKTSETNYKDQGEKIQFNENFLQIYRKVQTAITIDGNTATA